MMEVPFGSVPARRENMAAARPHIWRFVRLASTLDTAMRLAQAGLLAPWDSVQAASQTAGRGQLRRQWVSPPGNIYASLRLPLEGPLAGAAAAPAVGTLLAEALGGLGWPVRLKWPNDLVLCPAGQVPRKLAGILLEERGGVLLAGIGINVRSMPPPSALRAEAALEATCLAACAPDISGISGVCPSPGLSGGGWHNATSEALWQLLVKQMFSAYKNGHTFSTQWRARAEALLLWRGQRVELRDDEHSVSGRLAGLGPAGGLCLNMHGRLEEFFSGSLRLTERPAEKA